MRHHKEGNKVLDEIFACDETWMDCISNRKSNCNLTLGAH